MKKIFSFVLLLFCLNLNAQKSGDSGLDKRLEGYMQANRDLNFKGIISYIHPSLFKLVPENIFVEQMEKVFNNDDMKMGIDSIGLMKISPAFTSGGKEYRKVDYYMQLHLQFKSDEIMNQPGFKDMMIQSLRENMEGNEVIYSEKNKRFEIKGPNVLLAIKDDAQTPWYFLGIEKNQEEMMNQLLTPEVISHFKLK